jgi:uroporphyrinogen decarboxylase
VLYGSPDAIRTQVGNVLASYGQGSGHVFNLGHGMSPDMDPEHVGVLVDAVHAKSARN